MWSVPQGGKLHTNRNVKDKHKRQIALNVGYVLNYLNANDNAFTKYANPFGINRNASIEKNTSDKNRQRQRWAQHIVNRVDRPVPLHVYRASPALVRIDAPADNELQVCSLMVIPLERRDRTSGTRGVFQA